MGVALKKILVTGHRGMVGSALLRRFSREADYSVLTVGRDQVDWRRQDEAEGWLATHRPDIVIVAAAKVGGIWANSTQPADFLYDNLLIAANLIHGSYAAHVPRLLFLGSSCIYPKMAPQPMTEDCLLTGPLETTNEAYAVGKIAGLKLCQHYRAQHHVLYHSAMPTNLYGTGDNYHKENSHVIPALLRRFHEAKISGLDEVVIWGTGTPLREFLHVDDLADGCFHLLQQENPPDWVNIGTGSELSIRALAEMVAKVTGFTGRIANDPGKPDGTPRKLLDVSRMKKLGWSAAIPLEEGLRTAYADFCQGLEQGVVRL